MTRNNLISVLKAIGGLSVDGIFVFSIKHKTLDYVNDALLRAFDISHESFRHQPEFFVNHIVSEDLEYLSREFEHLQRNQKVENVDFRIKKHDGDLRHMNCSCYVLESGKYIVGLMKDVTDAREHENYIINYGAKKDALLEMVSHNLSGPLALSRHMIESLETVLKKQDPHNLVNHVKLIRENTNHCIEVVNDFLEEEHMVSESITPRKTRFDMIEKLDTIMERYGKGYPDFKFEVSSNRPQIFVINDHVKFMQVVNNLVSNAIKWSPKGSTIRINVNVQHDMAVLEVRDHGIGIPDHLKGLIFQKYTAASRQGLRGERSIGMGLYIVKQLVKLMEGTIVFESTENKGSTFRLTMPVDPSSPLD